MHQGWHILREMRRPVSKARVIGLHWLPWNMTRHCCWRWLRLKSWLDTLIPNHLPRKIWRGVRSPSTELIIRPRCFPHRRLWVGSRWNDKNWSTWWRNGVERTGHNHSRVTCCHVRIPTDLVMRHHTVEDDGQTLKAAFHCRPR